MKVDNCIKSIAIGSFDGMHIAHQALIERVETVVVIERNGGYLTPGYKRTNFTDKPCAFYHFDKIRHLAPEAFVAKLKEDFPKLEKIVVGYDFAFGKNKEGDAAHLERLFDGEVEIVGEITIKGISVHSRTIRALLKEGDMVHANLLLGRAYQVEGEVVRGQGLGKTHLVPTLNLKVLHYQLPKEGVYRTATCVDGVWLPSVSFLGHRLSTDGSYAVETHIVGSEVEVAPGNEAALRFEAFIRPNRKFETLDALKAQIQADIARVTKAEIK